MLNIAHRGASGEFPENTLEAFAAAIDAGAQMCELDVQLSADRVAVVIHDDTVDRTTDGRGAVAAMSLAELQRLDAGRKLGSAFAGARVPTLDEVLSFVKGRCALDVELKAAGVEREVCRLLRAHDALADTIVSSFDWNSLAAARELEPALSLGVLADKRAAAMLDTAARLRAVSVNPRYDMVSPVLVQQAHRAGFKVLVWTVDKAARMRQMIAMGVDGIMTNHPGRLAALLKASAARAN
ncbi:MAG TPA: glycerophosphodiester phosphodiesterase family protein [Candidatus Binataceae bacterium]|nr:glycerophosphodiester phosphodiesterase family protein [Candidatus Binataceae bacterium]